MNEESCLCLNTHMSPCCSLLLPLRIQVSRMICRLQLGSSRCSRGPWQSVSAACWRWFHHSPRQQPSGDFQGSWTFSGPVRVRPLDLSNLWEDEMASAGRLIACNSNAPTKATWSHHLGAHWVSMNHSRVAGFIWDDVMWRTWQAKRRCESGN